MKFRPDPVFPELRNVENSRKGVDGRLSELFRQRFLCSECTTNQTMVLRLLSHPKKVFPEEDSDDERLEAEDEQYIREKYAIQRFVLEREFPTLCKACAQFVVASDMDYKKKKRGALAQWKMLKDQDYKKSLEPQTIRQKLQHGTERFSFAMHAFCNIVCLVQVTFGFVFYEFRNRRAPIFYSLPYLGLASQTICLASALIIRPVSMRRLGLALLQLTVACLYYCDCSFFLIKIKPFNLLLAGLSLPILGLGTIGAFFQDKLFLKWDNFLKRKSKTSSWVVPDRFCSLIPKNSWLEGRMAELQEYHTSTPLGIDFFYYLNGQRPKRRSKGTYYERQNDQMDLDDDFRDKENNESDDVDIRMYIASKKQHKIPQDDMYNQLIQTMQPVSVSEQPVIVPNLFPFKSPHSDPSNNVLLEHLLSAYQTLYFSTLENTRNLNTAVLLSLVVALVCFGVDLVFRKQSQMLIVFNLVQGLLIIPLLSIINWVYCKRLCKSLFMLEKLLGSVASLLEEAFYVKLSDPYYLWVLVANRWFQRFRLESYFKLEATAIAASLVLFLALNAQHLAEALLSGTFPYEIRMDSVIFMMLHFFNCVILFKLHRFLQRFSLSKDQDVLKSI